MSYSREDVKAVTDKILNMAKADGVEIEFSGGERSATRYANSTITANLTEHDQEVTITVRYGQKAGSTTVHQFDDASLKRAIGEAQTLAKQRPDNPELMPLLKPPQNYVEVDAALPAAVNFGAAERARLVKQSVEVCEKKGVVGSGYIPKLHWTDARANSEGLFAYHRYAEASMILTCRTPDGTGSGWAGTTGLKDATKIDALAISETAAAKALASRKPRAVEPGTYTVVLEPRPAARFLSLLLGSLNARQAEEGRVHERRRARYDEGRAESVRRQRHDPKRHRQQRAASDADRNRWARRAVRHLDRKGRRQEPCLRSVLGEQTRQGADTRRPQMSLVMDGGDQTLEQMIKSTRRGLLVSFFWYIRVVDAMTLLNTGMTRDGLFLIENGEVTGPVQNFRWNDGPARGFNNITALGRPVPMHIGEAYDNPGTALVPPMRIEDFRMTSISPAV